MIKTLVIFAENCIADAPMLLIKAIFVSLLVGIVYAAAIGINIVHADDDVHTPISTIPVTLTTSSMETLSSLTTSTIITAITTSNTMATPACAG